METEKAKQATLTPEMAWDMVKELGAGERHFNGIEAQYRALASGWLLAALGGMGFLVKENPHFPIPTEVVVLAIAIIASIGILLLWMMDVLVYHRLLDTYFVEALKIEKNYPFVPQVRQKMIASQPGGEVITRVVWFYAVLITVPVLFGGPVFIFWCLRFSGLVAASATVALVLYVAIVDILVINKSPNLRAQAA